MITDIKKVVYDVKEFWDIEYNPYATILLALPDCTCCAYGLIISDGKLPPVNQVIGAGYWDTALTNGWMSKKYNYDDVEVGDILCWKKKGHVAVCSKIDGNKKIISASFYTGEHGKSVYDGKYDTRKSFSTLKELSDWMLKNYPTRYFHVWDINEEQRWVGGIPDVILKHPFYSHKEDSDQDQIQVLTFEQNVRDEKNNILKKAEKGFFNIISTKEENGYLWYEVEKNKFIAQVDGRVIYHEAKDEIKNLQKENKKLRKENDELKGRLIRIQEEAKYE